LTYGRDSRADKQKTKQINETTEIESILRNITQKGFLLQKETAKFNLEANGLLTEKQNQINTLIEWRVTD
jgi:hypothetical protein